MTQALSIDIVPWSSDSPKGCRLPEVMDPIEASLYERIRIIHCDRKAASHDCHGRVTLDRNGITMHCPLCGDVRSIYRKTP